MRVTTPLLANTLQPVVAVVVVMTKRAWLEHPVAVVAVLTAERLPVAIRCQRVSLAAAVRPLDQMQGLLVAAVALVALAVRAHLTLLAAVGLARHRH